MVRLGRIESPRPSLQRHELRRERRVAPDLGVGDLAHHLLGGRALRLADVVDARLVLRPHVVALAVKRGRVVQREEDVEDGLKVDDRRVEVDGDDLVVPRVAAADVLVRRALEVARRRDRRWTK